MTGLLGTAALLVLVARAGDDEHWLSPAGAGDFTWGTTQQPFDVVAKRRDLHLPDSDYVGRRPADRPEDLEIPGRHPMQERRFLRYVHGALVDAWVMREGAIDLSEFAARGREEWRGVTLGPVVDGFHSLGDSVSWDLADRTALYWKDRSSDLEILVSRSKPTNIYAVARDAPIGPDRTGARKARVKGDLKDYIKNWTGYLSGCLDQAPMPVEGTLTVIFDGRGNPSRVKVEVDQPTIDIDRCWAGAIIESSGPVGTTRSVTVFRMR